MKLTDIPVEQVTPCDRILVSSRVGVRPVVDVLAYDTLGLEKVDCFVVLYKPATAQRSYENRAGMKGVVTASHRDEASLRPIRRGDLVKVERIHLVERT